MSIGGTASKLGKSTTTWRLLPGALILLTFVLFAAGCPSTATGPEGPAGATGPEGPTGPAGADGQLRIYGDSNAPAVTITEDTDWVSNPPPSLVFSDFTIATGKFLLVPSGTIIRCSGTFTNNGMLEVFFGAAGGSHDWTPNTGFVFAQSAVPPGGGLTFSVPGSGECGDTTFSRAGGIRGFGQVPLAIPLPPGPKGGGGGAAAVGQQGGVGGGTLVILSLEGIHNNTGADIAAYGGVGIGDYGCGGGGGGIIILASPGPITHAGTIEVTGGDGRASGDHNGIGYGPGGGGGGGLVRLISPSIDDSGGVTTTKGGSAGPLGAPNSITSTIWQGGAGGGAGLGDGGNGGDVIAGQGGKGTPMAAEAGRDGVYLRTPADPTPLF